MIKRTRQPERRIAVPVTANGRKKPEGGFSEKEGNTNENIFKKKI